MGKGSSTLQPAHLQQLMMKNELDKCREMKEALLEICEEEAYLDDMSENQV